MEQRPTVILGHPTGNNFVRALLSGLEQASIATTYVTMLGLKGKAAWARILPSSWREELFRRTYEVTRTELVMNPWRDVARVAWGRLGLSPQTMPPSLSVHSMYEALDQTVLRTVQRAKQPPALVYLYEDGAATTFNFLRDSETLRFYELPIAYWRTARTLMEQECERRPDWAFTLQHSGASAKQQERKETEVKLADYLVVPSKFVYESLPAEVKHHQKCMIVPFGSPAVAAPRPVDERRRKLRVLFAGTLTQRKGLADLFEAVNSLHTEEIELVVLGTPLGDMEFYRSRCNFTYERPRSHEKVFELMRSCDLLVLPSVVEGRAMVQQEALACGLPIIVTPNAGGEDLVEEGTGFLVPIRDPAAIAAKLEWFLQNRGQIPEMREVCQKKARAYQWPTYADTIIEQMSAMFEERRVGI